MYNLPVTYAKIVHHEDVNVFTCTYKPKYCAKKTVLLEHTPLSLRTIIGAGKEFEWEEVVNRILSDKDRSSMTMKLNRSGSVQVVGDECCCAFDCVWKMLKYHPEFKDDAVAESMLKQSKEDITQFQDLRVWRKNDQEKRPTLQQIMQKHGYEFMALKDVLNKKVQKEHLVDEMFSLTRFDMFLCNLECVHGSNNHTVAIAKGSNKTGKLIINAQTTYRPKNSS